MFQSGAEFGSADFFSELLPPSSSSGCKGALLASSCREVEVRMRVPPFFFSSCFCSKRAPIAGGPSPSLAGPVSPSPQVDRDRGRWAPGRRSPGPVPATGGAPAPSRGKLLGDVFLVRGRDMVMKKIRDPLVDIKIHWGVRPINHFLRWLPTKIHGHMGVSHNMWVPRNGWCPFGFPLNSTRFRDHFESASNHASLDWSSQSQFLLVFSDALGRKGAKCKVCHAAPWIPQDVDAGDHW